MREIDNKSKMIFEFRILLSAMGFCINSFVLISLDSFVGHNRLSFTNMYLILVLPNNINHGFTLHDEVLLCNLGVADTGDFFV